MIVNYTGLEMFALLVISYWRSGSNVEKLLNLNNQPRLLPYD
jgi:hypothetical protein